MYISGITNGIINIVLFAIVYLIRRFVHKEGITAFLIQKDRKGIRLFFAGMGMGILSFSIHPLLSILLGEAQLNIEWGLIWETAFYILAWGFGFLGVALFEEALFRGYILVKLLKRYSVPVSIGVPALIFGAVQVFSYRTSDYFWVGVINVILMAIVMSLAVVKMQSLMWAWGFHLSWNLTQSTLFTQQNHGKKLLFSVQFKEGLLTGTSFVPEAGIFVTLILSFLAVYILNRFHTNAFETERSFVA